LEEEVVMPYFENVMKYRYAPRRMHLLEKLRTLFGIVNATHWEEKIDEADCKENTSWKYWKEKTDEYWW
jgi:hypothetical protein